MAEECPTCGFRLDAGDGAFLGAMAINYGIAGALFIGVLVAWLALTSGDAPLAPLLMTSLGVTAGAILFFYPVSKTLWAAIDVLLHRMDRQDRKAHDARG